MQELCNVECRHLQIIFCIIKRQFLKVCEIILISRPLPIILKHLSKLTFINKQLYKTSSSLVSPISVKQQLFFLENLVFFNIVKIHCLKLYMRYKPTHQNPPNLLKFVYTRSDDHCVVSRSDVEMCPILHTHKSISTDLTACIPLNRFVLGLC